LPAKEEKPTSLRYAFYTGCTTPYRLPGYELSSRKVAEALEIELVDMKEPNCCGLPIEHVNWMAGMTLSARNLSLAEEMGLDMAVICNGCAGMLARTNAKLKEDKSLRERVNAILKPEGLEFKGKINVKHLAKILVEDLGEEKLRKSIVKRFHGMKAAVHYGCHVLMPSKLLGVEDPDFPEFLDRIVEATGAKSVGYAEKRLCCGGLLQSINEEISLRLTGEKLVNIKDAEVNALVTMCPFCFVSYSRNQKTAAELIGENLDIPVVHYTQLLGLALGIPPDELELGESVPDPDAILRFLH